MTSFIRPVGLFILILSILAFMPASGSAQQPFDVTDGIRFGAFSIHPSIFTSLRYVDNVWFVPKDFVPQNEFETPQDIESDFILNVQPAVVFDVTVPTFTAQAGYKFYNDQTFGYDDPDNQHHQLNATNHTFSGLLDYQAPFGLILKVQDAYTIQEIYEDSEQIVDFVQGEQTHNDARGTVGYRHGPEDNIYVTYTYFNIIDEFKKYRDFNKVTEIHRGELHLKFFPRTALIAYGAYSTVDYERIQAFDMQGYWGMAGLRGQITPHLIISALGGYTVFDYQENQDGQGPAAEAEIALVWPSSTRLAFGYRRRFKDATNTNFYTSDEGYMRFNRLWGNRVNTSLFGSYQMNHFSEPLDRREDFIQANADVTLRLLFWLYTGAGYQLDYKIVDDGIESSTTTRNTFLVKMMAQF